MGEKVGTNISLDYNHIEEAYKNVSFEISRKRAEEFLYQKAIEEFGEINPVKNSSHLRSQNSFTYDFDTFYFWFNDSNNSTRAVATEDHYAPVKPKIVALDIADTIIDKKNNIDPTLGRFISILNNQGIKVVTASDITLEHQEDELKGYFSKDNLNRIIQINGKINPGKSLERLAEKYDVAPWNIYMIGDDFYMDINKAKKLGMSYFHKNSNTPILGLIYNVLTGTSGRDRIVSYFGCDQYESEEHNLEFLKLSKTA